MNKDTMNITKHYIIKGKVQHVGYRDFVKETAANAHLTGMANHADNADIRVIAQGAADAFAVFEQALRFGPVMAFVRSVESHLIEKSAYYRSFQVEGRVLSTSLTEAIKQVHQEANEGVYHAKGAETDLPQQLTTSD